MKNHFIRAVAVLAVAAVLVLGIVVGKYWGSQSSRKEELTSTAIQEQITELSQLTTAQLEYRGIVRYSEGQIVFLTKKEFTMLYDARVTAGIDLSQVQVTLDGTSVTITLPRAEVQSISIDPDSLEFYDESFALFNLESRTDTVTALQYAEDDINERVDETDLLETATERAETLITELIEALWDQEEAPDIRFRYLDE